MLYKRFEAYTAVKIQVEFYCVVTPNSVVVGHQRFGWSHLTLKMEAGWSSETLVSYHTASQPRRPRLESCRTIHNLFRLYKQISYFDTERCVHPYTVIIPVEFEIIFCPVVSLSTDKKTPSLSDMCMIVVHFFSQWPRSFVILTNTSFISSLKSSSKCFH